jgi:hypothetical protein
MTARPIFSESRRRPVRVAVALCIVMVAVLLAAGCAAGDCPQSKYTPIITKVSQNGTHIWTKIIDTGVDNRANDMIVTSDGGVVIAGSVATKTSFCNKEVRPNVIRLSGNGDILWDRTLGNEGESALSIVQTDEGKFLTALNNGDILTLNSDGKKNWNKSTGSGNQYWSIIKTSDNSFVFSGSNIMKTDYDGNILFQRPLLNDTLNNYNPIFELSDNHHYIMGSEIRDKNSGYIVNLSQMDNEGKLIDSTILSHSGNFVRYPFYKIQNDYVGLYSDDLVYDKIRILHLNPDGKIINQSIINGSFSIIPTADLGYFYAKNVDTNIQIFKLDHDGGLEWKRSIPYKYSGSLNSIYKIIQSADNSYMILYANSTQIDLSK